MLPPELVFPLLSIYWLWYCMSVSAKVVLTAVSEMFQCKDQVNQQL